jgi:hypothetical protein
MTVNRQAWIVGAATAVLFGAVSVSSALAQERQAAAKDAAVYIIAPKNGARIRGPVTVQFGLRGMGVAPAGIKLDGTGHHHLLVNTDVPANAAAPLPATDKIIHFGKGQTETTLSLPPGKHTLQLVLGDYLHIPHNPPVVSEKITITILK